MPMSRAKARGARSTGTLPLGSFATVSAASMLRMIFSRSSGWAAGARADMLSDASIRVPSSMISVAEREALYRQLR